MSAGSNRPRFTLIPGFRASRNRLDAGVVYSDHFPVAVVVTEKKGDADETKADVDAGNRRLFVVWQ